MDFLDEELDPGVASRCSGDIAISNYNLVAHARDGSRAVPWVSQVTWYVLGYRPR